MNEDQMKEAVLKAILHPSELDNLSGETLTFETFEEREQYAREHAGKAIESGKQVHIMPDSAVMMGSDGTSTTVDFVTENMNSVERTAICTAIAVALEQLGYRQNSEWGYWYK